MAKRKPQHEDHENNERWLLTYADMITLLMIFFILLFTISQTDKAKYETLASSLSVVFNGGGGGSGPQAGKGIMPGQVAPEPLVTPRASASPDLESSAATSPKPSATASASTAASGAGVATNSDEKVREITDNIRKFVASSKLEGQVTILEQPRGAVIRLDESLIFASGSATLDADATGVIGQIGAYIAKGAHFIRVEGHCDNRPINTSRFPSNWELAAARAVNVAKILINSGIEQSRISANSYGEYRPLVPNDTDADRRKNRRVEIVVLFQEFATGEAGAGNGASPGMVP